MPNTDQLIEQLKHEIETAIGRSLKTPRDFDHLALLVYQRRHTMISAMTLKRLWGYLKPLTPRESTLSLLAQFLGYRDWAAFCNRDGLEVQSTPIVSRRLDVERELHVGDVVRLTWLPGRVCDIRYEGNRRFTVVASEATRLMPGDTFECLAITEGEPLYLHALRQVNVTPVGYVCGKVSGVGFEVLTSSADDADSPL